MAKHLFIPVPYFQFSPDAATSDLATFVYKTVPNEKIHWHCPFIIIDAALIDKPIADVAIAVANDSLKQTASSELNDSSDFDPSESPVPESADLQSKSVESKLNAKVEDPVDTDVEQASPKCTEYSTHQVAKEKQRLDYLAQQEALPYPDTDIHPDDNTEAQAQAQAQAQADSKTSFGLEQESETKTKAECNNTNEPDLAPDVNGGDGDSLESTVIPNLKIKISSKRRAKATSSRFSEFDKDRLFLRKGIKTPNSKSSTNNSNDLLGTNIDSESESESESDTQLQITTKIESNSPADDIADKKQTQRTEYSENEDSDDNEENGEDDEDDELSEEEKLKQEKEAKLESYKQFVATQKSKIDIDYQGIRVDIEANALPSRMYFIMNALSAIIASYGLVINSAAVVIGAMLVAMMLGPISGVALAIIDYRIPFLRKSLMTVLAGGAMVVFIGFIVGFTHQDTTLSHEILSRTQPTSMDLMIALAGGTAGAYAMISPHLSVAVVGVAVATALVPPLAASGILFAHGEGALGLGALLLAITNIIAIQFTNALVLWFTGFRRLMEDDYKTSPVIAFFRRNAVPLLLLTVIGGYLSYNLHSITKKQTFENEVAEQIKQYFADKGNTLSTTQFVTRSDHQTVRAVIQGETQPSATDVQYLEQQVNNQINQHYPNYLPVRVQLRYLPVVVIESSPNNTDEISQTDATLLSVE
ncbi:DUF389 domain-containing protein [Psychrobacter lutiphocae]|uniref:DUF389 domain-containing protein n=1 Tax=Psychrobacter lutiphocae TaxID=540500 RepID=UPI0003611DE3|nr:DUF389 domain-containing protein [Psychrobacter lutiphocae]